MRDDIRIIRNEKDLSNREYVGFIGCVMDTMNIIKSIIDAYDSDIEISEEDKIMYDGLSEDEIRSLDFIEDLEVFDFLKLSEISLLASNGLYSSRRTNTLLMNALDEARFNLIKILDKINHSLDVKFVEEHLKPLKDIYKNLNYCILVNFELFRFKDTNELQESMYEYVVKNGLNLDKLVDDMIGYYKDNRPTLPLLSKYPELLEQFEENIPDEFFFDLVELSSMMRKEEIMDLANGILVIDESYIEILETRMYGGSDDE